MEEKIFDTIKCLSADNAVKTAMMEYQRYLVDTKLPHPVDGLKDVARRAIYVMGVKKEFIKFAQFIASIMELHPHGDSSIQSAVERLFRTYDVRIPLIRCDGNVGTYTGEPGAPRYLDVTSSEFARDLFFNGVHASTIPMKYTVEFNSIEPKYFIPRLPNALLMGNLTIGLGFKSVVFPINLEDVCILVQKYIDHVSKHEDPFTGKGYEEHFIPDFPTNCTLRNYHQLLEKYKDGIWDAKVYTDGIIDIDKHEISIRNMPALLPFNNMHDKLLTFIKDKNHWINKYLRDFKDVISDKDSGNLELIFKNNVNTWDILEQIKSLVGFSGSVSPIFTYENDSKIMTLTPPMVLDYWYKARHKSIVNGLNYDQNQLLKENMIIDALLLIVDHKEKVISIVKNSNNREEAINALSKKFDITLNQATAITKSSLEKLVKASKDELYKQKDDIKSRLTDITEKFSKINDIIYNDAVYFRKKYSLPRKTRIAKYIGYIRIGNNGIYQYENEQEMFNILNTFTNLPMSIHQYKTKTQKKLLIYENRKIEEYSLFSIPKQINGQHIFELTCDKSNLSTIVYMDDTVSCINNFVYPKNIDNVRVEYISGNKFIGITKNGKIDIFKCKDLSQRKSISSGAKCDLMYSLPHYINYKEAVVMYMSTSPSYTNQLYFTRIFNSKKDKFNHLMTTPPHDLIILDTYRINDTGVIINIPKSCVNMDIRYVYIEDINRILGEKISTTINIRSGIYKYMDGKSGKPSRHIYCSNMIVL